MSKDKTKSVPSLEDATEGDFVEFREDNIKGIVDWLLVGDEKADDVLRFWLAASIPCKICGTEGLARPEGAGRFAISFMNIKHGRGIRFFCDIHAQMIQDELVKRGIEITTKEQLGKLNEKINVVMAMPDDEEGLK